MSMSAARGELAPSLKRVPTPGAELSPRRVGRTVGVDNVRMDAAAEERIARNEALFREANEAIRRGVWPDDPEQRIPFRCECAQLGCHETVRLTVDEYERVRQHPRRFVLVDGHDIPEAEDVVARADDDAIVVEKTGHAGEEAQARDPRA